MHIDEVDAHIIGGEVGGYAMVGVFDGQEWGMGDDLKAKAMVEHHAECEICAHIKLIKLLNLIAIEENRASIDTHTHSSDEFHLQKGRIIHGKNRI